MRFTVASLSLLLLASAQARAVSALTALQLLSPEQAQRVAVIAGRDGTPEPERWHFILHDPKAENGLREIVITGGHKTADRTLSQFAESVAAADVIAPEQMKIDSPQVAQLAREFGTANNMSVSALHFELRKSGPDAKPLWTVTCLDVTGAELGKIFVSAATGTVIMHPGFTAEPQTVAAAAQRATPAPIGADETSTASLSTGERSAKKAPPPKKRTAPQPTPRPNFFQRVFGGRP